MHFMLLEDVRDGVNLVALSWQHGQGKFDSSDDADSNIYIFIYIVIGIEGVSEVRSNSRPKFKYSLQGY